MAMQAFEEREIQVPRSMIDTVRQTATAIRRNAEEEHRRALAKASRVELFASMLEQGYTEEEARRRAFRRLDS